MDQKPDQCQSWLNPYIPTISPQKREKIKKTKTTFEGYFCEKYPQDFVEWNTTRQKEDIQEPGALIEPNPNPSPNKISETRKSMSSDQREIYEKIKQFTIMKNSKRITFPDDTPSGDKEFVLELGEELGFTHIIDENLPQALTLESELEDEEIPEMQHKVLKRYEAMQVVDNPWHAEQDGLNLELPVTDIKKRYE